MNIYDLKAIYWFRRGDDDLDGSPLNEESIRRYCRTKCMRRDLGIFSSKDKAVEAMTKFGDVLKSWEDSPNGYYIFEKKVDDESALDAGGRGLTFMYEYESVESYLSDYSLNCRCGCDDGCRTPFTGRNEPVRLKPGDYAMHVNGNECQLVKVRACPFTAEEWKTKLKPGAMGDYSDDCYAAITPYGHCHPLAVNLFPVDFEVDSRIKRCLTDPTRHIDGKAAEFSAAFLFGRIGPDSKLHPERLDCDVYEERRCYFLQDRIKRRSYS